MFLNCHLASGAFNSTKRSEMMAKILKDIGSNSVYPDALADFCILMGDMNYRFKTTYSQHIDSVHESQKLFRSLDELVSEMSMFLKFPGYQEMPITFEPTYKRDAQSNSVYINKND